MPFIDKKEEVLVRIIAQRDKRIYHDGKGIIGGGNLYLLVFLDVLGNLFLPFHVTMYTKEIWVTCRLVLNQSAEWHGKDSVARLRDCQCCCATASNAFVEYAVGWNLLHSLLPGHGISVGEVLCSYWSGILFSYHYYKMFIISYLAISFYYFYYRKNITVL